jgi:uncharacterized protein YjbJ (UPF0337 family)
MSELTDRITGRVKKAAGDLVDDPGLREQGVRDERKADAKEELARAQHNADQAADEVARLERQTAGRSGSAGTAGAGAGEATGSAPDADRGAAPPRVLVLLLLRDRSASPRKRATP